MKSRARALTPCLLMMAAFALSGVSRAHHGDEFLFVDDYTLDPPGAMHFGAGFGWERHGSLDAFGSESMCFLTIAPMVALSVSATFLDEGGGWDYSSVTPRLHVQLTPPEWDFPVRAGLSIGCQIVDGAAGYGTRRVRSVSYERVDCGCAASASPVQATPASSAGQSNGGSSPGGGPVCDPSVDVDCVLPAPPDGSPAKHTGHAEVPAAAAAPAAGGGSGGSARPTKTLRRVSYRNVPEEGGHDSGGIHNHHSNLWIGRFIVETDLGPTKAIINIIGISPEGAAPSWGYAVGLRHQISHHFGAGVEAIGDFDPRGMHEVVAAAYYSPVHSLGLKLGAGFGLTDASPDFSFRSGIIWRF